MNLRFTRSFFAIVLATVLCVDLSPSFVGAGEFVADVNAETTRVAVVTGSNKGIGFAIVKGLCERFDGIVYLTARSEERGLAAVEKLKKSGCHPWFHQLDVNDDASVETFKNYLYHAHGGLDVLVNNAGILFKENATESFFAQAAETIRVNYFSLLRVSKSLFPLLRPHARVVQTSSALGHLSEIPGAQLKAILSSPELTEDQLSQLMRCFVEATETNTHQSLGWPNDVYAVSKAGVAALTRIQQREFDLDAREDLVVNSIHPGYVSTDLTDHLGIFSPERGARSSLCAALLPRNTDVKGKFIWHDCTIVDWVYGPVPSA